MGAGAALGEFENRLKLLTEAVGQTPKAPPALRDSLRAAAGRLQSLRTDYSGDASIAGRSEAVLVTIMGRVGRVVGGLWSVTGGPTGTQRRSLAVAADQFGVFLPRLREFGSELRRLEDQAEAAGAPWTPGRMPNWRP
jgi:hypothetical protein